MMSSTCLRFVTHTACYRLLSSSLKHSYLRKQSISLRILRPKKIHYFVGFGAVPFTRWKTRNKERVDTYHKSSIKTNDKYLNYSLFDRIIYKLSWAFVIIIRFISIFLRFIPFLCTYPLTLVFSTCHELWWRAFVFTIEKTGPTFIKLAQWASSRHDLFSQHFCERFSRFHRSVSVHKWKYTEEKLKRAFGENWRKFFVSFDSAHPVGSGCVAQVYKAVLKLSCIPIKLRKELGHKDGNPSRKVIGIPVAVKVCHPDIQYEVERDLVIMAYMARWLSLICPSLRWLSVTECISEFACLMEKQIDLTYEANNLETFTNNFCNSETVSFPKPVWPYVWKDVLVETFKTGEHISNLVGSTNCPVRVKQVLAGLGVKTLIKMIFVDNFVHGDLHPGNILVQNVEQYTTKNDSTIIKDAHKPKVKLVLLDVGITASLSKDDQSKFVEVFKAVIMGKGDRVAKLFLTQSRTSECVHPDIFTKEMSELVQRTRSEAISLGRVKVGALLSEVFGLMIKHKIKVESHFASVLLALAVLEGLGRSLDPNLDILEFAKPYLLHGTKQNTGLK